MAPPTSTHQTGDAALVERVRQGDRSAFSQVVQLHQQAVFQIACRYVRQPEDAKDVTQAVFVKAWQAMGQFRGDASLRTWLYRIAVHVSLNWLRDHARHAASPLREDAAAVEPAAVELDAAETSAQLRQAVGALPEKQRLAVELRIHDGLSFRDIGEVAGCSEDAAKANFHHGLKKLKSALRPLSP